MSMKNNTSFYTLFVAIAVLTGSVVPEVNARVRDYETTRLKSTGGAGVGSILMNESAILNPASIGFFDKSSFYIQNESTSYRGGEVAERGLVNTYDENTSSTGVIVADTKKNLKGAISYQKQQEGFDKRTRFSGALASALSEKSTFGIQLRKTEDRVVNFDTGAEVEDDYMQTSFGVSHAIDEDFTIGALAIDPFKNRSEDTRAIIGAQYVIKKIMAVMLDVGGNWATDLGESRLYRAGLQLNVFSDFFLRAGTFEDRTLDERGNGFGAAWVGPKLVLEAAFKTTRDLGLRSNDRPVAETARETAFSLSYFF